MTYLEARVRAVLGKTWKPSILRAPSALCPHTRKVRSWLNRHGILEIIRQNVTALERRIDNMERKEA